MALARETLLIGSGVLMVLSGAWTARACDGPSGLLCGYLEETWLPALLGLLGFTVGFGGVGGMASRVSRPAEDTGRVGPALPLPPGSLFVGLVVLFAGWIVIPYLLLVLGLALALGLVHFTPAGYLGLLPFALMVSWALGAAALGFAVSAWGVGRLIRREPHGWPTSMAILAALVLAGAVFGAVPFLLAGLSSLVHLAVFRERFLGGGRAGRRPGFLPALHG